MTDFALPRLTRRAFLCGTAATAATALITACGGGIILPASPTAALWTPTAAPANTPSPIVPTATSPPQVIPCGGTAPPLPVATPLPRTCGFVAPTQAGGQTGTTAWRDYEGRISLQYPSAWTIQDVGGITRHWIFSGPDGLHFDVTYSDPKVTPDVTAAKRQQDQRAAFPDYTFTFGPVTETRVGDYPATRYDYTVVGKDVTRTAAFSGRMWIVFQGARWFTFDEFTPGAHRAEVDAIITSIRFLRRQNGDY